MLIEVFQLASRRVDSEVSCSMKVLARVRLQRKFGQVRKVINRNDNVVMMMMVMVLL